MKNGQKAFLYGCYSLPLLVFKEIFLYPVYAGLSFSAKSIPFLNLFLAIFF